MLGDLNWDMLNTLAVLQSKLDDLNLTQIIKEPTRYNPKSLTMGTLLDIILTNLLSKYTSAVFNQDLSDHCLNACVRNESAVKRPHSSLSKAPKKTSASRPFYTTWPGYPGRILTSFRQ